MRKQSDVGAGRAFLLFSLVFLGAAALVGLADIVFILRHYVTFPYGDQWVWMARVHDRGVVRGLYAQYNEHRLTIPGLFFLIDYRWFSARNGFLIVISLLFQLACTVLLILPVWWAPAVPKQVRFIFSGMTIILMFWFIQGEDLFYPYQLQIASADLGVLTAACFLSRAATDGRITTATWIAVLGAATWATFSFGSGMVIWPVVLGLGVLARVPKRLLIIAGIAFLCVMVLYFADYHTPPGSDSPMRLIMQPVQVAHYMTVFLGLPFFGAGAQNVRFITYVGPYMFAALGVLTALGIILRLVRKKPGTRTRPDVMYGSTIVFCLGAAFLAAMARSNYGVDQALSGRYAPMSLIFWISLAGVLTIEISEREGDGGLGRVVWAGVMAIASVLTFSSHIEMGDYMALRSQRQAEAALSIAVGVPDSSRVDQELASLHLVTLVDEFSTPFFHHSLLAFPEARWLGTPLQDHFHQVPGNQCLGSLDLVNTIPNSLAGGVRVIGWAWDAKERRVPSRIWITDSTGIIRGLGLLNEPRLDVATAYHTAGMGQAGWVAYSRVPPGAALFTAYAQLRDGNAVCPVGSPHAPAP